MAPTEQKGVATVFSNSVRTVTARLALAGGLLVLLAILLSGAADAGSTWTANSVADSGTDFLRWALTSAQAGDRIAF
jgi:hypothetical protein